MVREHGAGMAIVHSPLLRLATRFFLVPRLRRPEFFTASNVRRHNDFIWNEECSANSANEVHQDIETKEDKPMLHNLKRLLTTGTLLLAAMFGTSAVAAAQTWTTTFTVVNGSRYRIDHLYVSPVNYAKWGYDRLGNYVLAPGYRYELPIVRGWYDVKLVDKDGDQCVLRNIDFTNGDTWMITDRILLVCEYFSGM